MDNKMSRNISFWLLDKLEQHSYSGNYIILLSLSSFLCLQESFKYGGGDDHSN